MAEGNQEVGWQFDANAQEGTAATPTATPRPAAQTAVTWTASEYIEHDKSAGWYVRYVLVVVLVIGGIFALTRDIFSLILLGTLAVIFGIFAARKPAVLQYKIDNQGITIGQKYYPISLFRSFAIIEEGAFRSITLLPMKRFQPPVSLHYDPQDEAAIMEAFGNVLPQESRKLDSVDRFMQRIRF